MNKKSPTSVFGAVLGLVLTTGPLVFALIKGRKRQRPESHHDTQDHSYQEGHPGPWTRRAELYIPQSGLEEYRADRRRDSRRDWIRLGIETLGLIAIIAGGIAAFLNIRILTKQADISAQQLDLTDRPWLKAELALEGPFKRQQDSVTIPMTLNLFNVGKSVASGIDYEFELMPTSGDGAAFTFPIREQHRLCELAISRNAQTRRLAIFPGDPAFDHLGAGMTAAQMAEAAKTFGKQIPFQPVLPMVVGCVDYQFGALRRHHQTMFLYEIRHFRREQPDMTLFFDAAHIAETPREEMALVRWYFGGNDAS